MESLFSRIDPGSRILLIEPPFYRFFGYERWHYPVTLTLVGTYFEQRGHHVRVYDADKPTPDCRSLTRLEVINNYPRYEEALANEGHPIWREVSEAIAGFRPDVVGLTSITPKIDSANIIARMVRGLFGKRVLVMLGGAHVQGMSLARPDHDFGPDYDLVVPRIPGLIRLRPNKKLILDLETYSPRNLSGIMTSSGCPNTCTFCCHSFEKSMTYRAIEDVRREVEEIKDLYGGTEPIYIMDDCFFSNGRHFEGVSTLLHDMRLRFKAGARIMALSESKLDSFIRRGGEKILVGVESGSQRILDKVEKRLKVEDIVRRTKWLNDFDVDWSAFFMVGFPFETIEDLKMTEDLIDRIRPTFVSINRFTPYPGTKIYQDYYSNGNVDFRNLFQLNRKSCVRLEDEVEAQIERMFVAYDKYNALNRRTSA